MNAGAAVVTIALCSLIASACSYRIVAPSAQKPVSASGTVWDAGLAPRRPDEGLQVVQHFRLEESHWSWFWGLVPLQSRRHDISGALNQQLDDWQGDAIVNLMVETQQRPGWVILVSWMPLAPIVSTAIVEGDVVRAVEVPDAAATAPE